MLPARICAIWLKSAVVKNMKVIFWFAISRFNSNGDSTVSLGSTIKRSAMQKRPRAQTSQRQTIYSSLRHAISAREFDVVVVSHQAVDRTIVTARLSAVRSNASYIT
jgi:hypothetical protein